MAVVDGDPVTLTVLNEIGIIEQLARARLRRAMPPGMQISQFTVLNHFARLGGEKSPAQLAKIFQVTKGAMTNTINRLETAGYVRVTPDEEDGRKKLISITEKGRQARDHALASAAPVFAEIAETVGAERMRNLLPGLRELRILLDENV